MLRPRLLAIVTGLLAAGAVPALAQGSVFSIRGLGFEGRPVSARAAGSGGALDMFDPQMVSNPAALTLAKPLAPYLRRLWRDKFR